MTVLESLLQLSLVLLTTGGTAAPDSVAAAAYLRTSLLSASVQTAGSNELTGVVRWQQTEDVPSDLAEQNGEPDSPSEQVEQVETGDAEPLDAEPLDADLPEAEVAEVEPLDAEVTDDVADVEPLDAPLAETAPPPVAETIYPPAAPAPAPVAVAPTVHSKRIPALPSDFGRGVTIVRNPPAGVTAEVPTDCERVLQHGRAVIGLGCGDDGGPWWLSQVGHYPPPPAHPAPTVSQTGPVVEHGAETAPPPPSQNEAVIVSAPSADDDDDDAGDGETIGYSTVTVDGETTRVPNVSNVERISIDRSGGREVETDRGGDGNRAVATSRGGRITGLDQRSSTQAARQDDAKKPNAKRTRAKREQANRDEVKRDKPTRAQATRDEATRDEAKRGKADKKNPCAVAKQKARADDVSKKELAKQRAKCKHFKKATAERRPAARDDRDRRR